MRESGAATRCDEAFLCFSALEHLHKGTRESRSSRELGAPGMGLKVEGGTPRELEAPGMGLKVEGGMPRELEGSSEGIRG